MQLYRMWGKSNPWHPQCATESCSLVLKKDKFPLEGVQKRGASMIRGMENLSDKKRLNVPKHIWPPEIKKMRENMLENRRKGKKKKSQTLFSLRATAGTTKNEYRMAMNKVRL